MHAHMGQASSRQQPWCGTLLGATGKPYPSCRRRSDPRARKNRELRSERLQAPPVTRQRLAQTPGTYLEQVLRRLGSVLDTVLMEWASSTHNISAPEVFSRTILWKPTAPNSLVVNACYSYSIMKVGRRLPRIPTDAQKHQHH